MYACDRLATHVFAFCIAHGLPTMLPTFMANHGNITKITRKNKAGKPPTVRYRFRMGRDGKPISFKTRSEAVAHQKNVAAAIKSKGHDALDVLDKTTLSNVTTALGVLRSLGLDSGHLVQACRSYTAAMSDTALTVTISRAVEQVLASAPYQRLKPTTTRNYRYRWQRLCDELGHDKLLGAITVFEIEAFLEKQEPKSQIKYYADLRVLFGKYFVKQLRHMSSNLMDSVVPPPKLQGERRVPYTYGELTRLLECVEPFSELDVLMHLNFFTGMRTSECIDLTYDMINMRRGHIYLPYGYAKTKHDRNIDIVPKLLDYLEKWLATKPSGGRLFSLCYRTLREQLHTACEVADVPWKGFTGRITYISHAFEGVFNKQLGLLQFQVGHSFDSKTTLNHYVNAVDPREVKPYFLLPLLRLDKSTWDYIQPDYIDY